MTEHTETEWTCNRCGHTVTTEHGKQPKNWIRVYMAHPARSADKEALGDLCNRCGGRLVGFVEGREKADVARDEEVARIMLAAAGEDAHS